MKLFVALEEIADKLPEGVKRGRYSCIKSAIIKNNQIFIESFDKYYLSMCSSIFNMREIYVIITNHPIYIEPIYTKPQRDLISFLEEVIKVVPPNQGVVFINDYEPCFRTVCKEVKDRYLQITSNIFKKGISSPPPEYIAIRRSISEIYKILGYASDGTKLF